jgi:hypothetical protein
MNAVQKLSHAAGAVEREGLGLICHMEGYKHGESPSYKRNQREELLYRARLYAAAVRRLARLRA